jgi:DNA-binding NarL/FixJ family response regulator
MPAEFEPTTDQRALVQNAAAFGINQADIANQFNIDEKTLRKHFRDSPHGLEREQRQRDIRLAFTVPCRSNKGRARDER